MSNQFITNSDRLLSEVFNNILPSTQNLYFLVGFFYFSGFEEIYENIDDKNIKILVGLDVEKDIFNKIKEFEVINGLNKSRGEVRQRFNRSLIEIFNDTDFFDSEEKQEAFKIFLSKIKDGTLEIRKTLHPNHSKLYLFEKKEEFSEGGEYPGSVITGSSNLSRSGLRGQHEINVVFRDEHFNEGLTLFNSLWDEAVNIADKDSYDDFINEVIENIWLDKLPKPYLLYIRVLQEYFSMQKRTGVQLPADITNDKFINLKYQTDAIEQALNILDKHNGVIIADVVGLGKSIIASAIANNTKLKTTVIAPPHLVQQWEEYRYDFSFIAKVYSSGKIQQALDESDFNEPKLIIVDEAHKYRNEMTEDYALLHELCHQPGNKVVLLSATPFNNRPQDIFSMIKLFQIPTHSTIRTVENLSYQFRELIKEYKKIRESQRKKEKDQVQTKRDVEELADRIRDILAPLVIRRSRIDLDQIEEYKADLKSQKIEFPTVKDPEMLEYDLGEMSELYSSTLERIAPEEEEKGFVGARYMPATYIKNIEKYKKKLEEDYDDLNLFKQAQRNLAGFMRHLLVRRFESSVDAFYKSLDSMIKSSEYIKEWYDRVGQVPIYKKGNLPDLIDLFQMEGEELEQNIGEINFEESLSKFIEKGLILIEKKELKKAFYEDLCKDIDLLKNIKKDWFRDGNKDDPKLKSFLEIVKKKLNENPKRKIIVFSEFGDTVNYLYDELKDKLKVFSYTSTDSNYTNKRIIRANFDAGIPKAEQENKYDVLLATDAISEGFNLHRAGIIFNYDIPYNPTRVIQRVGRINRINKKVFDELFIYNFFPSVTGEAEVRVKEITSLKLMMIHALIGEDTKVLSTDEELKSFFVDQFKEELKEREQQESWDTKYRNELTKLRGIDPELYQAASSLPKRVRIARETKNDKKGVVVFGKKGDNYTFKFTDDSEKVFSLHTRDAIELFEAKITEDPKQVTDNFEAAYQLVKANLFTKKSEVARDKGKQSAIDKIDLLLSLKSNYKDYLKDLLFVIRELDSLPDRYLRQIRKINEKTLEKDISKLMKDVSHQYLIGLIQKAKEMEDAEEHLILAEELI